MDFPRHLDITNRQREMLEHVWNGHTTNKDIAIKMGIEVNTVKHQWTAIFAAARVDSKLELVLMMAKHEIAVAELMAA